MNNSNRPHEDESIPYVNPDYFSLPLREIIQSEHKFGPPLIIGILVLVYAFNVVASLIRGSTSFNSILNIELCSSEYWGFSIGFMCVSIIITVILSVYLRGRTRKKINVGYNFDSFDIIWSFSPCFICVSSALFAGFSSGLVSIGGGLIMTPIMLKLGLRPEIVVPTSSFIKLLTSSLAIILFVISGDLNDYSYALWVAGSALIGSLIGIIVIKKLVNKFKRASLMVIAMTILLVICTIVVITYSIMNYDNDSTKDNSSLCSV